MSLPTITWSLKEIGKCSDVSTEICDRPIPQEVIDAVQSVLSRYPQDAHVFVDTGGRLDKEFGTFNLRIEINKNKRQ